MKMIYFPDPVSGWLFVALVMGFLGLASYTDQRNRIVPKWLTLPALGLGLLISMLRGGWLAAHALPVWAFGSQGVVLGGLDGLLFALSGFLVGFVLLFTLWLLGVCGGGDVKLLAALGAWIGPVLVVWVVAVSLVLLCAYLPVYMVVKVLRGRRPTELTASKVRPPHAKTTPRRPPTVVKYSLVVASSAVLVLLWAFKVDLHLAGAVMPQGQEARSHGR